MNEVTIDEAALAAEADSVMASVDQPADAPADASAVASASWGPFVAGLVPTLRGVVFAQWLIHPTQVEELQASLSICLDQAFPGGLAGPYACWARLGMCCVGIGAYAMVQNGGKLPPLGLPRAVQQKEETGTAAGTDSAH